MINDLIREIVSPNLPIMDRLLALLVLLIAIFVVFLVLFLVYNLIDEIGIRIDKRATTRVVEKQFTAAHATTMYVKSGAVMVPIMTWHPDRYALSFVLEGYLASISVDKDFYEKVVVGDIVSVYYGNGRLSGAPVADSVSLNS